MKYCVDKNNGIVTLGQEIEYVMSHSTFKKQAGGTFELREIRVPEDLKGI